MISESLYAEGYIDGRLIDIFLISLQIAYLQMNFFITLSIKKSYKIQQKQKQSTIRNSQQLITSNNNEDSLFFEEKTDSFILD